MYLKSKLPTVLHSFLSGQILDIPLIGEKIATCTSCTLCNSPNSPYQRTKCCTYHPHLPNYLVGGILKDLDYNLKKGKQLISFQLKNNLGVTPYGIIPTVTYSKNKKVYDSIEFWSRPHELAEAQHCPYYDNGHCSIWAYRENLCVTYFCSSIGGKYGKRFWKQLNKYLKLAETNLAQYAMLQMGWPPSKIKTKPVTTSVFELEDEQGNLNEKNYAELWGEWKGREKEFFVQCYEMVSKLDPEKFKQILGISGEILEASVFETHKAFLENVLPDYLKLHPELVFEKASDEKTKLILETASTEIPTVILPFVRGFNGKRSTVDVFHMGYNVLYNMSDIVDELREKGMLINA